MTNRQRLSLAPKGLVLLTGATGYVGGRLLPRLESGGYRVRCLTRRPDNLGERISPSTQVVQGDLLDAASLDSALVGVDTAYYFVHSMGAKSNFEEEDREAWRGILGVLMAIVAVGTTLAALVVWGISRWQ